jgi:hypothetical protein
MNRMLNVISAYFIATVGCIVAGMFAALVMSWVVGLAGGLHPFGALFFCLIEVAILASIISAIQNSYCKRCRRFFLVTRTYTILVHPTYESKGKRKVFCRCVRCSDRREHEEELAMLQLQDVDIGGE